MFSGKAEEAIQFYISLFDGSEIRLIGHYENERVMHAARTLQGQTFMAIDHVNGDKHPFAPAMSLLVTCEDEAEMTRRLSCVIQERRGIHAPRRVAGKQNIRIGTVFCGS
ncbi:MAG TPA: VOC family protein [Bacillaceae bacterium]